MSAQGPHQQKAAAEDAQDPQEEHLRSLGGTILSLVSKVPPTALPLLERSLRALMAKDVRGFVLAQADLVKMVVSEAE